MKNMVIKYLINVKFKKKREKICNLEYSFVVDSLKNENPSDWPGEMGEAYFPPDDIKKESERRFPENMFDIAVSDRIALNRAMPDIRNEQ